MYDSLQGAAELGHARLHEIYALSTLLVYGLYHHTCKTPGTMAHAWSQVGAPPSIKDVIINRFVECDQQGDDWTCMYHACAAFEKCYSDVDHQRRQEDHSADSLRAFVDSKVCA